MVDGYHILIIAFQIAVAKLLSDLHSLFGCDFIGSNVNQILLLMRRTGHIYDQDIQQIKEGVNEIWHTLLSI